MEPIMRPQIDTNRLTLRPFHATEAQRVATLVGDWDVCSMLARVPFPYAAADAEKWFADHKDAHARGENFVFAIATPGDGVIGCIGLELNGEGIEDGALVLGYWFGKPYWGRGYATEAGAAALAYAEADTGVKRFRSGHFAENPGSGKVLEKLGFAYTGEVKPQHCLARGVDLPSRKMARASAGRALP
jgi:[ribosomal protein S5]-alanine N-acetyltransferase